MLPSRMLQTSVRGGIRAVNVNSRQLAPRTAKRFQSTVLSRRNRDGILICRVLVLVPMLADHKLRLVQQVDLLSSSEVPASLRRGYANVSSLRMVSILRLEDRGKDIQTSRINNHRTQKTNLRKDSLRRRSNVLFPVHRKILRKSHPRRKWVH